MIKKVFIGLLALSISMLYSLEFGHMGQLPMSMGGAGVAVKRNHWALYYNPGLLGFQNRSSFAYSMGLGISETNYVKVSNVNTDNLNLSTTFDAGNVTKTIEDVFINLGGDKNKSAKENIDSYLKTNGNKEAEDMKNDLINALNKTTSANTEILKSIIYNGSFDAKKALEGSKTNQNIESLATATNVKLTAAGNPEVQSFINEINRIYDFIQKNNLSVNTQNGVVATYSGKENNWGLSLGVLSSAYINASATMNGNLTYNGYNLDVNKNYIMVNYNKNNTDSTFNIYSTNIGIIEVPVGYGYAFGGKLGTLGIGGTVKYIYTAGYYLSEQNKTVSELTNINFNLNDIKQGHTWGVDIGTAYMLPFSKNLVFGAVLKNVNTPRIDLNNNSYVYLNPQLRAGVSYSLWKERIVLALDADLMPNKTLSASNPYSQILGGGILLYTKYADIRAGMSYDFFKPAYEAYNLTAGLNLLGFLDISVASSLNLQSTPLAPNLYIPSYLNVKVGGNFSW